MPPDTFTHLLTQPPGQTDLCLPQCSDDLLRSVSLPSHPDLLAEKLQTRSILTLHLVSFQGVRSEDLNGVQGVAGSNPAVPTYCSTTTYEIGCPFAWWPFLVLGTT